MSIASYQIPDTRVTSLTDALVRHIVYDLTEPVQDALSPAGVLHLERSVAYLVRADRFRDARALVADTVRVTCLEAEIRRHGLDCCICGELGIDCYVAESMGLQADKLHRQIALNGGGL